MSYRSLFQMLFALASFLLVDQANAADHVLQKQADKYMQQSIQDITHVPARLCNDTASNDRCTLVLVANIQKPRLIHAVVYDPNAKNIGARGVNFSKVDGKLIITSDNGKVILGIKRPEVDVKATLSGSNFWKPSPAKSVDATASHFTSSALYITLLKEQLTELKLSTTITDRNPEMQKVVAHKPVETPFVNNQTLWSMPKYGRSQVTLTDIAFEEGFYLLPPSATPEKDEDFFQTSDEIELFTKAEAQYKRFVSTASKARSLLCDTQAKSTIGGGESDRNEQNLACTSADIETALGIFGAPLITGDEQTTRQEVMQIFADLAKPQSENVMHLDYFQTEIFKDFYPTAGAKLGSFAEIRTDMTKSLVTSLALQDHYYPWHQSDIRYAKGGKMTASPGKVRDYKTSAYFVGLINTRKKVDALGELPPKGEEMAQKARLFRETADKLFGQGDGA